MENLVSQGWRVIREWRNRFGNHWVLLTPEGRIWSGVDNVRNKSKAWRRLLATVPANIACSGQMPAEPPCEIARSCYFGQDGKCLRGGICR
jgi:hypothetical protein